MPKLSGAQHVYPTDVAGNSGSITTNHAGGTESLTLPLRGMTEISDTLTAGAATASGNEQRAVSGAAATVAQPPTKLRGSIESRSIHASVASCKHATTARKGSGKAKPCSGTRRVRSSREAFVTVVYGQPAKLSGRLTTFKGRKPIVHATIIVEQQVRGRRSVTKLGSTRTNRKGASTFQVKADASRTLIAVYNGSARLRGAQVNVGEHVKGKASLHVTGILTPGHDLLVSGKLEGGFVPHGGALVTIQYAVRGFRGWTNWGD